jgi:hypothetical protein
MFLYATASTAVLEPTKPNQRVSWVISCGVKWPGREDDQSPPLQLPHMSSRCGAELCIVTNSYLVYIENNPPITDLVKSSSPFGD